MKKLYLRLIICYYILLYNIRYIFGKIWLLFVFMPKNKFYKSLEPDDQCYKLLGLDDEFHSSLNMDIHAIQYMNDKQYKKYYQDLAKRRRKAHIEDLKREDMRMKFDKIKEKY